MWIWLSCASPLPDPPLAPAPAPAIGVAGERIVVRAAREVTVVDTSVVPESVAVSGDGRTLLVVSEAEAHLEPWWIDRRYRSYASVPRGDLSLRLPGILRVRW